MKRMLLHSTTVTGLLCMVTVSGQENLNLSGTWVKDAQQSQSLAQQPAAVMQAPVRLVIEQSPTDIRVNRLRLDGQSDGVTYSFGPARPASPIITNDKAVAPPGSTGTAILGAPGTDVSAPTGTVATVPADTRAEWKDGRLLLLTALLVNGQAVTTTERLALSADGRQLTVETELAVQHGYETVRSDAKAASTAKDVYIKAND